MEGPKPSENGKPQEEVVLVGPALAALDELRHREKLAAVTPQGKPSATAAIINRLDLIIGTLNRIEIDSARRAGELEVKQLRKPDDQPDAPGG